MFECVCACVCECVSLFVCLCNTNDTYESKHFFKVVEEKVPQNLEILVMLRRFLVIQDHRITLFSDCGVCVCV